jgi:DivIVA domain-containing protein
VFVLEVLIGVAVLAAVAMLAAGRFDGLAEELPDDPDIGVPEDRALRSSDLPNLRFRMAIRGYRMSDVDAALAAVEESLRLAEGTPAPFEPVPPPEPAPPFEPTPPPPPAPPPMEPEPVPAPVPPLAAAAANPYAGPDTAAPRSEPSEPPQPVPEREPEPSEPEPPTAEQPPTDAEDRPLSDLEAETVSVQPLAEDARATPPDASSDTPREDESPVPQPPAPASWQLPPPTGP